MASRMPVATALLCLLICVSTLEIDKSDGGYRDLLISINEDVPYNETIVVNIKSLLRSSSQFLHRATNGLVYFKHVTINFPNRWPKRSNARRLSSSLFEKGDVRIDLPAESQEQERPFTKQWKLCGKPGEYIKVTPTFLAELNDSTTKTFGNPAYVFVHEWAHYRYGVFDEHGWRDDEKYPLTYCEVTGLRELKLNACSSKFTFDLTLDSGDSCPLNKTTCTFHEKCVMRIKTDVTDTVESSIMFMPYVANVSHFCDSTNGARQHNPYAPSEQNAICQGRSTWEVISENEDFTNLARANLSKRIETTFEETQHAEGLPQRVVMALDVSDSMKGDNRMTFLKDALTRYVRDISDGSKSLAIVTFSSSAAVLHPLMPVNASTRQSFLNAVKDLKAAGQTCIGCGLQRTLQVLNTTDEKPEGGIVVLMSDSEENMTPKLNDVLPELMAAKVGVSTIAMGTSADHEIETLATMTDGKAFFFPGLQANTAILLQIAFEESTIRGDRRVDIRIANFAKAFTTRLEEKFILDSSLGKRTVVILDQLNPTPTDVSLVLIDPSGRECKKCVEHGNKKTKTVFVPNPAKDGQWTIRLDSPSLQQVEVNIQVKSQAKDPNDEPIRVTGKMASLKVAEPNDAIILTDVYKGWEVVLDAMVVADVYGPNPPYKTTVRLNDGGIDPDIRENEGTYSGYFVQFTGKGRYVVTVHVSGDEKTRLGNPWRHYYPTNVIVESPDKSNANKSKTTRPVSRFKSVDLPDEMTNQAGKPTGAFQRVVYVGSFEVTENIMQSDVPPGDIWDFKAVEKCPGANDTLEVKFSWTWPGAHMTFGNASAVDIRVSNDAAKLDKEFEKQKRMTAADVVEGNLDPLPAGSKHEVTLVFSSEWAEREPSGALWWMIFLAARVVNSDGLNSYEFNVIRVLYLTPPAMTTVATNTTVATTTEATTPSNTTEAATRGPSHLWVWFLITGIAVVIVIVAVLIVLFRSSAETDSVYGPLVGQSRAGQPSSDPVTDSDVT